VSEFEAVASGIISYGESCAQPPTVAVKPPARKGFSIHPKRVQ
jgi:hypothetical protein